MAQPDYEAMSQNYSGWLAEKFATRERTRGQTQARMAMGGIKTGSELWQKNIAKSGTEFDKQLKELRGGYTAENVREDFRQYQKFIAEKPTFEKTSARQEGDPITPKEKQQQSETFYKDRELKLKGRFGVRGGRAGVRKVEGEMEDITGRYKETYGVELKDWEAWAMATRGEPASLASAPKGPRKAGFVGQKDTGKKSAMMGGAKAKTAASPWIGEEEEEEVY